MKRALCAIVVSSFFFSLNHPATAVRLALGTDSDALELGRQFPNVGMFFDSLGRVRGTGTLIDTGFEHLNGRVVLTAAHLLVHIAENNLIFSINDRTSRGQRLSHPVYKALKAQDTSFDYYSMAYDIGLFLLDTPMRDVRLSRLNFSLDFEGLLEQKHFLACGFGETGSPGAKVCDGRRRAAYGATINGESDYGLRMEAAYDKRVARRWDLDTIVPPAPPCKTVRGIIALNAHSSLLEPSGFASPGDSGGPLLVADHHELAGVISGGRRAEERNTLSFSTFAAKMVDPGRPLTLGRQEEYGVSVKFHQAWLTSTFHELALSLSIPLTLTQAPEKNNKIIKKLGRKQRHDRPHGPLKLDASILVFSFSERAARKALAREIYLNYLAQGGGDEVRLRGATVLLGDDNIFIQHQAALVLAQLAHGPSAPSQFVQSKAAEVLAKHHYKVMYPIKPQGPLKRSASSAIKPWRHPLTPWL